jgi:hypothetical protein
MQRLVHVPQSLPSADGLPQLPVAPLGVDARSLQFAVPQMPRRGFQIVGFRVQSRARSMPQRMHAFGRHLGLRAQQLHVSPGTPGGPISQHVTIFAPREDLQGLPQRGAQGHDSLLATFAVIAHL